MKIAAIVLSSLALFQTLALANPTKVGNGDAGGDLEKMDLVQSGVLITTRDKAIEILNRQNISTLPGLAKLIPELQKADIYLNSSNVSPVLKSDQDTETSDDGRFVYARTFAEPHAPVRFFPAALLLTEEQIINLHIHEALHRALPASINENEAAVSEITLALTSSDANYDRTKNLIEKYLAASQDPAQPLAAAINPTSTLTMPASSEKLKNPSSFGYSYTAFSLTQEDRNLLPIQGIHQLNSLLYPFGDSSSVRGIGVRFSYIQLENRSFMGPLSLSGNVLFTTWRGFDVEGFAEASLYTLSTEELKALPKTRDTATLGISLKRDTETFYTENFIALTPGSTKNFKVGNIEYKEEYKSLLDTRIEAGMKFRKLSVGLYGDFLLTEGSRVSSSDGLFTNESERIRAFKIGPRLSYRHDNLQVQLYSQHLVDRTPGYTLTDFGHLMGLGAGTSAYGASLSFNY